MTETHQCSNIIDKLVGSVKSAKTKSQKTAEKFLFRQVSVLADTILQYSFG